MSELKMYISDEVRERATEKARELIRKNQESGEIMVDIQGAPSATITVSKDLGTRMPIGKVAVEGGIFSLHSTWKDKARVTY